MYIWPTSDEKLVKLGPVLAEIFGMISRFLPSARLVPKGTETHCKIFGVSGPMFTKIGQDVSKNCALYHLKSRIAISVSGAKCQHVE